MTTTARTFTPADAKRITLKSVKIAASLSEETLAHTATICLDGRPVFTSSNHGHGAADDIHPHTKSKPADRADALEIAHAWVNSDESPQWLRELGPRNGEAHTALYGLEILLGERLEAHQEEQRLRRLCRTKIVVLDSADGAFYTYKAKYTPANAAALKAKYPTYEIVNERFL